MPKKIPVISLLTDFGLQDQYVGVMKAALLTVCRPVQFVDLSHAINSHNVLQASFMLWSSYRHHPKGTIFLCVVDPGVGTSRDILIAKTKDYLFLAPDNGLLDPVLWDDPGCQLTVFDQTGRSARAILPDATSKTFHGRDIFAPLVGHLALGEPVSRFGKRKKQPRIEDPFVRKAGSVASPKVLHVDRFGNIVTNIVPEVGTEGQFPRAITIGSHTVDRWINTYLDARDERPCLNVGSSGLVEIVINQASAATALDADIGTSFGILR